MVKLILIDIDGTLVTDDKALPEENERAIKEALDRGIKVTLVTGRNFSSSKDIIGRLELDVPVVLQNGAFIYKPISGEVLLQVALPARVAKEVVALSRQEGVFYIIYKDFLAEPDMLVDEEYSGPYTSYFERNAFRLQRVEDVLPFLEQDVAEVALMGPEEAINRVIARMGSVERTVIKSLVREGEAFYEIFGPGVGKGEALRFLCEHFGVAPGEVMYIGDAYNDIDIMPSVGYPVAMGNAVDELKKVARYVTKSNNEAGVAEAIRLIALSQGH
ncbi:HAD family phosphatase [Coprothermobacteraceae bacterium]|nr:HAD family phosphatase [Coprothermobacteraceae bacterium]